MRLPWVAQGQEGGTSTEAAFRICSAVIHMVEELRRSPTVTCPPQLWTQRGKFGALKIWNVKYGLAVSRAWGRSRENVDRD